jgi:serine/threonine protein kinase
MAPEMILEEEYDQSVDLWSFGMVLIFMLQGDSPFFLEGSPLSQKLIKTQIVNT